ncbi:MAG: DUF3365 domain-containing protein, partial [Helicobacteraceae bacterium]|nr:DUF3365 domain-containing protein [Helicobacteraceae bacterium]
MNISKKKSVNPLHGLGIKLAIIALGSTIMMANPYESNTEELESVVKTGQEVSATLLKTLGKNLQEKMKAGGTMAAAEFCTTKAYALTASVDNQYGKDVHVKRISLKERNPANQADNDEKVVLESLDSLQNSGVVLPPYLVERVNKETYKFYKPLTINKQVCLKCHGDIANN